VRGVVTVPQKGWRLMEWFHVMRAARIQRNMRQEDVAKSAGITRAWYSKTEKGRVDIRISTLKRIAKTLGGDVGLFFPVGGD